MSVWYFECVCVISGWPVFLWAVFWVCPSGPSHQSCWQPARLFLSSQIYPSSSVQAHRVTFSLTVCLRRFLPLFAFVHFGGGLWNAAFEGLRGCYNWCLKITQQIFTTPQRRICCSDFFSIMFYECISFSSVSPSSPKFLK